MMAGAACLTGIGFTMSLFLTGLSFPPAGDGAGPDLAAAGKIGTLLGSLVAGLVGGLWLLAATREAKPSPRGPGASA